MTEATSEIEARIHAGERLDEATLRHLATIDVLTLGMLADEARKRRHAGEATFVRVFETDVTQGWTSTAVPDGASEVRLRGLPATLDEAAAAVAAARAAAGSRVVSGFSLADITERSSGGWGAVSAILARLRAAGLDAVAEAPIDRLDAEGTWWAAAREAGLSLSRLTVDHVLGPDRVSVLLAVRRLQDAGAGFEAMAPLPRTAPTSSPTTGYDDVRAVALARLALDNVPSIQVHWQQYGPKLAQVALTFGADDIDGVSAEVDASQGWRRAPVEDVRRNIAAARLKAVERDGRFAKMVESGGGPA
jgi:hypothetical protein